jgi:hypothetical protein
MCFQAFWPEKSNGNDLAAGEVEEEEASAVVSAASKSVEGAGLLV